MMFAHGFGCDQNMWRFVAPAFESSFGRSCSTMSARAARTFGLRAHEYASLSGYADDLVEIGARAGPQGRVFVGHSVSAMIGVLASLKAPELFESLVLVGPVAALHRRWRLCRRVQRGHRSTNCSDFLSDNYMGWSAAMAPAIMGKPEGPNSAKS